MMRHRVSPGPLNELVLITNLACDALAKCSAKTKVCTILVVTIELPTVNIVEGDKKFVRYREKPRGVVERYF